MKKQGMNILKHYPVSLTGVLILLLSLWSIFSLEASNTAQRYYKPTKAQLRIQYLRRLQQQQIREIRRRQAIANAKRQAALRSRPQKNPVHANGKILHAPLAAGGKTAPHSRIRYILHNKQRFVLLQDVAKYYGMTLRILPKQIQLKSSRDTVVLQQKKRNASVNQQNLYLTHAPLIKGAMVYLNEKDFFLVIDPVIRNAPLWKHRVKTIMVDAGHGGKDKGAPGARKLLEKNLNLQMANKLAWRLRRNGYKVIMTRTKDVALTLQQRADLCAKHKPDLFISVHCNAAKNKKIKGVETFAMTPQGAASTSDKKAGTKAEAGNAFDKNNYRLAYEIQKQLVKRTAATDRGVKHARFFVLRKASCPAVLVETGFISHASEGVNLSRSAYQNKIITGIVAGVNTYVRASAPPMKKAPVNKKR